MGFQRPIFLCFDYHICAMRSFNINLFQFEACPALLFNLLCRTPADKDFRFNRG